MTPLSTHRLLQLSVLLDDLRDKAPRYARASLNALSIGNETMARRFMRDFVRCTDLAFRLQGRLDAEASRVEVIERPSRQMWAVIPFPPRPNA